MCLVKIIIGVYLTLVTVFFAQHFLNVTDIRITRESSMKTLQQLLDGKKYKTTISIAPNRPVFDALVILAEYKIGALIVIEAENLVGIFSERDYAREVILKGRSSKTTSISEVMTSKVISALPSDSVEHAMSVMTEHHIRHLPVVENNKVLGVLSIGDLVKETITYQQELIKQLQNYITL